MILAYILHLIKIMPISDGMYYAEPISALAIGSILGGAKALTGLGQILFSGRARREPENKIPKEVIEATELAKSLGRTGMPSEQRTAAVEDIERTAMLRLSGAQSRRSAMQEAQNIQQSSNLAFRNLAAQDASMRLQNQRNAQMALMNLGQYRDKLFANQWQSWANREQQRRALLGAGMQNIMGGLDFVGSMAAMSAFGDKKETPDSSFRIGTQSLTGVSGMNAIMGAGIRPPGMPGSQLSSPSNVAQPSYGLTSDQMLSRSIFQSLIR